jgi:hypothetical protein
MAPRNRRGIFGSGTPEQKCRDILFLPVGILCASAPQAWYSRRVVNLSGFPSFPKLVVKSFLGFAFDGLAVILKG